MIRDLCCCVCALFFLPGLPAADAQGTAPTFSHTVGQQAYTLLGHDPAQAVSTTIPTVLVPIELSFAAKAREGKPLVMAAEPDVRRILSSPIFSRFAFSPGNHTQYGDALLRTTFPGEHGWHTLLGKPEVRPLKVDVPLGYGYILTSKKEGTSFAVVDAEFLQQAIFKQLPRQEGKLILAVTHNTTYYSDGDATECCSWGAHGVDTATGNSFVLSSYLRAAPAVVRDRDVQPITQQLGEFINDPLHDPLFQGGHGTPLPGNNVPSWTRLPACRRAIRAAVGAPALPPCTFCLNPPTPMPKTRSRHPQASPRKPAPRPIICRTSHCCPGIQVPLPVSAAHTVSLTQTCLPAPPSRALHARIFGTDTQLLPLCPRSRQSQMPARATATSF